MAFSLVILVLSLSTSVQLVQSYLPPYLNSFKPLTKYQLPELPYEYSALEPFIEEKTLRNHHEGHHQLYTQKMNVALLAAREEKPELKSLSIIEMLCNLSSVPVEHRQAIVNNGGGYVNHNLYWSVLSPNPDKVDRVPPNDLTLQFQKYFGSFGDFKDLFTSEATKLFGSGYVWLVRNVSRGNTVKTGDEGKAAELDYRNSPLAVMTTANQDSPMMHDSYPILVLDVWEHSYYLTHQYRRTSYISHWWMLVDWAQVEALDHWWGAWLTDTHNSSHDEL